MKDHSNKTLPGQMPLFDLSSIPSVSNEPTIEYPQFSDRIRRQLYHGIEHFSLIDIMGEFSDLESRPIVLWRRTKKRLEESGFQLYPGVIQLKMLAKDGKERLTDCAPGDICLRIVQSIPSPKAEPVREWLASLGYREIQEAANPLLGVQRTMKRYLAEQLKRGESRENAIALLPDRIEAIDTFKELMKVVAAICDQPNYGQLVNTEYKSILGETADNLKIILDTKHIRDSLPAMQLNYIKTAESALRAILAQSERLTMEQIVYSAMRVCEPLGKHLQEICELIGVDRISGKPLLKG